MSLVLDCSVALAWLLPDEAESAAATVILRGVAADGAFVPPLWLPEVGNALLVAHRRSRISERDLEEALMKLTHLPVQVDQDSAARCWTSCLSLARWHGLSLYDAVYLDLARHRALPLATLDRQLRRCARDDRVPLLPA